MKIRIDHLGLLNISRGSVEKRQYCPYQADDRCGDWCPFGGETRGGNFLTICQSKTLCGEIIDERE